MTELDLTRRALEEMPSNMRFGVGAHHEQMLRALPQGRYMGSTEFRPGRHLASDINQFSLMGMAFEQDMVDQFESHRPLMINVIIDASTTTERLSITEMKQTVAKDLGAAILDARIAGDRVFTTIVGDDLPDDIEPSTRRIETTPGDAEELRDEIVDLAVAGLSFVISDFRRLKLPQGEQFDNLVAIKVNHPWERQFPEGVGVITLRGLAEANTDKPKQVRIANERLEAMHQATVADLESHGAQVVSVVAMPKSAKKYDVSAADQQIAEAIETFTKR